MKASQVHISAIAASLLTLCIIRPGAAQIVGCEGDGIECNPDEDKGTGICLPKLSKNGIGVVSFDSNITSDGPLTWTLTVTDESPDDVPYSSQIF